MKNTFGFTVLFVLLGIFFLLACCNITDPSENSVSYPYTEHEIIYLGYSPNLTSFSSDQDFATGFSEVLQTYLASHPSSNEFTLDGVTYEAANLSEITGGVLSSIWDLYWSALDKFDYSVGSCWGFGLLEIPSRGGTGTIYLIYTIIKSTSGLVQYKATKGNLIPKN